VASFLLGGQDDLAPSATASQVRANLAALSVLRTCQRESRPVTPAEQEVLARCQGGARSRRSSTSAGPSWPRDQARQPAVGGRADGRAAEHAERPMHGRHDPPPGIESRPGSGLLGWAGADTGQRQLHRVRPRQHLGDRIELAPVTAGSPTCSTRMRRSARLVRPQPRRRRQL
jgi:hypothetical protein